MSALRLLSIRRKQVTGELCVKLSGGEALQHFYCSGRSLPATASCSACRQPAGAMCSCHPIVRNAVQPQLWEVCKQHFQPASNCMLWQSSQIPCCMQDLHAAMEAHLRLHFNNAESSDENVLNIYPTPLRKRILRFLYLKKLEECYLFKGCKPKLLDALLGSATVHLFMPKVKHVVIPSKCEPNAAGGPAEICHFPAFCPRSGNA